MWRNARTSERPRSPWFFFLLSSRVRRREYARAFYLFIYLFFRNTVRYDTRARLSQGGRNVPFDRFYLLLRAGTSSQLTRPRKNELPFLDRFTSGKLQSLPAAQIARRSRYVSATRARINNGVNERRVSRTWSTFFPLFDRSRIHRLVRGSLESTGNVSELRERIDRSIDRRFQCARQIADGGLIGMIDGKARI